MRVSSIKFRPDSSEPHIAAAIEGRALAVAATNPAEPFAGSDERSVFPRLIVPASSWAMIIGALVASADAIVIDATTRTRGVLTELKLAHALGRTDDTIVYVNEEENKASWELSVAEDRGLISRPALAELQSVLARFEHVVSSELWKGDDSVASEWLRGKISARARLTVSERARQRRARLGPTADAIDRILLALFPVSVRPARPRSPVRLLTSIAARVVVARVLGQYRPTDDATKLAATLKLAPTGDAPKTPWDLQSYPWPDRP